MRTNQAKIRRRAPVDVPARAKVASRKQPMELRPVRSAVSGPLPEPQVPVPAELHFGILLRRARERQGMSVQDVVRVTRIAERWLPALEEGRLDLLPAPVFVTGYVRAYARFVGLDEGDMVERYQALVQQRAVQMEALSLPEPVIAAPAERGEEGVKKRLFAVGCSVLLVMVLVLLAWAVMRG